MNVKFTHRVLIGTIAVLSALTLTACGSSGHSSKDDSASKEFNDADVMFAQMMIPHHEQAVEMSELTETRASDAEVKQLSDEIKKAQGPEIETMTKWLKSWDKPTSADHDMGDDGMVGEEKMKELAAAKGKEFDKLYAELMIDHHEGAVAMAEDEQQDGKNAEAKKLADTIVETQNAEIKELNEIVDRL